MDFADQIKELAGQVDKNKDRVINEQATKYSMVMPFLKVLGYDIFDPAEVVPEYSTELVGKNEKVDYAIIFNKDPMILIEVKKARTLLRVENVPQLMKYFNFTKAKFAILTNGIQYQFFSDLDDKNKMDIIPFLTVDLVPSISDRDISDLKKFRKENFDADSISLKATELKYTGEMKRFLKQQVKSPEEDFTKFFIKKTSFPGIVTKATVDQFSPIVKNAFDQYLREMAGDKLNVAWEITKETEEKELRPKEKLRLKFWTQLLGYARTKTDLHSRISPGKGGWYGTGTGMGGLEYCYTITKHQGAVELYIDRGKKRKEENNKIFERLLEIKDEIERSFGKPLEWERVEEKQVCRLRRIITDGGYLDQENWPNIQETMVEDMIALEKVFRPYIEAIKGEFE